MSYQMDFIHTRKCLLALRIRLTVNSSSLSINLITFHISGSDSRLWPNHLQGIRMCDPSSNSKYQNVVSGDRSPGAKMSNLLKYSIIGAITSLQCGLGTHSVTCVHMGHCDRGRRPGSVAASCCHLQRVGGAARLPWDSLSSLVTSDRQAMLTLPHHSHNDFREFQMNYLII